MAFFFPEQPTNPAAAETDLIWLDSGATDDEEFEGLVGDLLFDQPVTLFIESAAAGGPLRVMNGGGAGDVIPADTPTIVRVTFIGYRTRLRLRTGATPPTIWHVNGRVTQKDVG